MKIRVLKLFILSAFILNMAVLLNRAYDIQGLEQDKEEAVMLVNAPKQIQTVPVYFDDGIPVKDDAGEEDIIPEDILPEDAVHLADIDIKPMLDINPDVVGWIEIPDTELSYPLLQGTDNQYYLSHSWKKDPNGCGSVFLEYTNNRDFGDFHTIAYAHRMRNDTMFGTLKYYKDLDFQQEHPYVYVVTDTAIYRYHIFSVHEAGITDMVYRLDLEEEEFVRYCVESSDIDTGVVPEAGDRILTLSTCTGNGHSRRFVVHGVLDGEWDK